MLYVKGTMPFYSRRKFIGLSFFSAIGTVSLFGKTKPNLVPKFFKKQEPFSESAAFFDAGNFEKLIGREFIVNGQELSIRTVLTDVISLPGKIGGSKKTLSNIPDQIHTDCYFLLFKTFSHQMPQATYSVHQQSLGRINLLLVPGISPEGENFLVATINQL